MRETNEVTPPLPLCATPAENETWHSYLTRRASQHACTVSVLASHLGIRDRRGRWPGYYGIRVSPGWSDRAGHLLGLSQAQIRATHLETYDQIALDLHLLHGQPAGINATRLVAKQSWVHLAGSAYCPPCLQQDDGIWRLAWRLPWSTVCPRHGVYLESMCPGCKGVPGTGNSLRGSAPARVDAPPDGRLCERPPANPKSRHSLCGADLTTTPTTTCSPESVRRDELLGHVITRDYGQVAGQPLSGIEVLRGWQHAACLARHFGRLPGIEWGHNRRGTPPRDRYQMDQLLEAAEPLITAPNLVAAADVLESWCRDAGHRSIHADTFIRVSRGSQAFEPVIGTLLRRRGRAHVIAQRRLPLDTAAALDRWDIDDVPQLVWPCALPTHLRACQKPSSLILRAVVAMILIRIRAATDDWPTTGALLGLPTHRAKQWTRYAFSSAHDTLKDDLIATAHRLASKITEQPGRANWRERPVLTGNGLRIFRSAQLSRVRISGRDVLSVPEGESTTWVNPL